MSILTDRERDWQTNVGHTLYTVRKTSSITLDSNIHMYIIIKLN